MSHHQPQSGPYGEQPGPYGNAGGQPQAPNPYAGQPGYGYPAAPGPQAQPAPPAQPGGYGHPAPQQQPNPYAQGGGYGQGGYGQPAPQQPQPNPNPYAQPGAPYAQGPYAQPQPAFPQQPMQATQSMQPVQPMQPQPAPYGPPTPGGNGGGGRRKTGLAIGAALAVVAAAVGGYLLFAGNEDTAYELSTPQTVAGDYQRVGEGKDESNLTPAGKAQLKEMPVVEDAHPVSANYQTPGQKKLQFSGVWGKVTDPNRAADLALAVITKALVEDGTAETVGSPQKFSPDGFDGDVLKCQELKFTSPKGAITAPACVWGDESTVGVTVMADPAALVTGAGMTLNEAAGLAAEVRSDARVEAG
ncbi:hypothetical protein [Streptomyces buecherae]|uniref:hypothetical protein n=1 Tax=Streptomyces buecherae TaxID=2763006 RepID=UPI001C2766D9|nr:hypothetical protein [Streptomyces buecherae]